jgi:hypothetical protein
MKQNLKISFSLGDIIYLRTDPYQMPRLIVSIEMNISNGLLYKVVCGTELSMHYEEELSTERNTSYIQKDFED